MGKLFGGGSSNAGQASMGESVELMKSHARKVDALEIPDTEKQKIKLELQKIYFPEEGEKVDFNALRSQLEEIPGGEQMMEETGAYYDKLATEGGLSPEQRQVFDDLQREQGRKLQAGMETIERQMAERGTGGSGSELAAKMAALQGSAERGFQGARDMAAQAAKAQRDVHAQKANLGAQLAGQQMGRTQQSAELGRQQEMADSKFAQQTRAARQAQEEERVGTANKQQQLDAGLSRQKFQDEITKAGVRAGAVKGASDALGRQGASQAAAAQAKSAGRQAMFGSLVGAGAMAYGASDKNLKKDISSGEGKVRAFLDNLDPYKYKYKDEDFGEGEQLGIMAQDLEKSEEGDKYVMNTPEGKMVDYGKMAPTMLASLADIHERLKEVEEPKEGFEDGGFKRGALGSIAGKHQGYEQYEPKLDAKEQIAQFNRTNGRDFSMGGLKDYERKQKNDGDKKRRKEIGDAIAGFGQGIQSAGQSSQDDAIAQLHALANQGFEDGGTKKTEEERKKDIGDAIAGFGKGMQAAGQNSQQQAIAQLNALASQSYEDGGVKDLALGAMMPAGTALALKALGIENPLSRFQDGGLKGAMDEVQPEQESFPIEEIQAKMEELQKYAPEEVDEALASIKEQVILEASPEERPAIEEQFVEIERALQGPEEEEVMPVEEVPMQYADGGMAYEDGGEGTIIPGDSYAGDELPDRINSGEMVLNVEQQQRLLDELKQLKGKRVDDMLDDGELEVNPMAQEKLMDVARGEASAEDIEQDDNIVEAKGFKRLLGMLGR